jgi:hypothetical protein
MIIKFNCSVNDFNRLYIDKEESRFNETLIKVFESIDSNDNLNVNEENYLDYNNPEYFYLPINVFQKILNDIKRQNDKMDSEVIADLLEHSSNIIGLNRLINKLDNY